VIIVVEGPSGAGKTTWCRIHGGPHALLESLPDHATVPDDEEAAARFWVERNVARWAEVHAREERDGLVVVDTDPFKLQFTWTLYQSGQTTRRAWELMRDVAREAFTADRYGLADLIYVSDLDEQALRARREADTTRTRRNFERHVKLRNSLIDWYRAIDAIEPGRVVFGLPDTGIDPKLLALGPRKVRSGAALFDRLIGAL
jgi:pantothenate kinase-related protein Tda10